jgi:hypothetical protein
MPPISRAGPECAAAPGLPRVGNIVERLTIGRQVNGAPLGRVEKISRDGVLRMTLMGSGNGRMDNSGGGEGRYEGGTGNRHTLCPVMQKSGPEE